jgi:penicillin-binding protein 1C
MRIFSAEATSLLTEILLELKRPDMPRAWGLTRDVPAVAWKTGTSYGHRDAWSVGFSSKYSIGVWVGNFDGHGQKGLSGSEFAAPLLFDLFRAIEGNAGKPQSKAAQTIAVCALSHALPTEHCRDRVSVAYIPGRTKLAACTMHRPIFIDRATKQRLAGSALATRPYDVVVATFYSPELVAYWRSQNQPLGDGPVASDERPRIVSPDGATPYRLRRDAPIEYQEILLEAQTADASKLYWFEDGVLVASGDASRKMFLRPKRGSHQLVVVDDNGRSDSLTYRVE